MENNSTVKIDPNITDATSAKQVTADSQSGDTKSSMEVDPDVLSAAVWTDISDEEFIAVAVAKKHTCEICAKQFRDRRGLQRHQLTCSHAQDMKTIAVGSKYSDKKFESDNSYTVADEGTSEGIKNKHLCDKCAQVFYDRTALSRHILSCQSTVIVPCPNCDKVFDQICHLKVHFLTHLDAVLTEHRKKDVQSHADRDLGEFRCDYIMSDGSACNKLFSRKDNLHRHMDTHFDRIKPFACKECPKRYYQKSHLQDHVATVHSESSEVYPCPNCKKVLKTMRGLTSHKVGCGQQFH